MLQVLAVEVAVEVTVVVVLFVAVVVDETDVVGQRRVPSQVMVVAGHRQRRRRRLFAFKLNHIAGVDELQVLVVVIVQVVVA